ncbi:hypothetical protein JW848_06750 [Candidatus Bipolaricaulota bacterium]|nr:hypothetical protein [Candidatus Bipolaricaulota bacterium]
MKRSIRFTLMLVLLLGLATLGDNLSGLRVGFRLQDCEEMPCVELDETWVNSSGGGARAYGAGYRLMAGQRDYPASQKFAMPIHLEVAEYELWECNQERCCELQFYFYCYLY